MCSNRGHREHRIGMVTGAVLKISWGVEKGGAEVLINRDVYK